MEAEEIKFTSIEGVRMGQAQDVQAGTGVTVLAFPAGAHGGVAVSGGGPASRETPVLSPVTADVPLHAVVLSGGSAYGLAAGDGVMRCLEEHGIGYDTRFSLVPIVCQSCLYDLAYGNGSIRPDAAMGYEACQDALQHNHLLEGNVGAGTGATVGKICGMQRAMKAGLGAYAVQVGALKLGAVVAVNALGDIYEADTGRKIAGLLDEQRQNFADSREELYKIVDTQNMFQRTNTTIGAIVTNGQFDKAALTKLARMAGAAYSRCISPTATMADGDTIYAVSTGVVAADLNVAGTLAADVMARAIHRAVKQSQMKDDASYLQYCRLAAEK